MPNKDNNNFENLKLDKYQLFKIINKEKRENVM